MINPDMIRLFLGNISEDKLPDAIIQYFIDRHSSQEQPLQIYLVVTDCLNWLVSQATVQGAIYTKREEAIGDEEIKISSSVSELDSYKQLLKFIQENPGYLDPQLSSMRFRVIVGGVRQDQFKAVKADPNSRGLFDERSPWTPTTNNNISNFKYEE